MKYIESYTSKTRTSIRYYLYEPKVILRAKGVVQIHHALSDHADRYEHFANFLVSHGFVVVVSDFVGHGKSLIDFEQGYFGPQDGVLNICEDIQKLVMLTKEKYSDVPYFLLGCDIGSNFIMKYMTMYGDYIDGAILLGVSSLVVGYKRKRFILSLISKLKGPESKGFHFFNHFNGLHNEWIENPKSEFDWLTTDEDELEKYMNDPMAHFAYSVQAYNDIIENVVDTNKIETLEKTPKHIAIYIGYGDQDHLSRFSDTVAEKYKNAGMSDVTLVKFKDCRHLLLFEKNKKDIYFNILDWLNERTYL